MKILVLAPQTCKAREIKKKSIADLVHELQQLVAESEAQRAFRSRHDNCVKASFIYELCGTCQQIAEDCMANED